MLRLLSRLTNVERRTLDPREHGAGSGIPSSPQQGDLVIKEDWAQSGFANTDLDFQLKQHGIVKVIVIGLLANTCIESTSRLAMEPGYHVTLVKDATAAFSKERMHAAQAVVGRSASGSHGAAAPLASGVVNGGIIAAVSD